MQYRKIILYAVVAVGIGVVVFLNERKKDTDLPLVSQTNQPTGTVVPTASIRPSKTPTPVVRKSPLPASISSPQDFTGRLAPAECSVGGSLVFLDKNLYESKGAFIQYKNIDSDARHIIWLPSIPDAFVVGPNLFANLTIPEGRADLSINMTNKPEQNNHTLKAKVTYGVFKDGTLEIRESMCTGSVDVSIKF